MSNKYQNIDNDLITRALYDSLADGQWHDRRDVIAVVARQVPEPVGYRWRLKPGSPELTGIARAKKTASGQRGCASNRVMIHTRRVKNIEVDPANKNRIRLRPEVTQGWHDYKSTRPSRLTLVTN